MKIKLASEQKQELVKRYFDGESVSIICLQSGVSRSTFYTWIKPYKNATKTSLNVCAADYAKLKHHCIKLENMISILKSANCTTSSPLQLRLEELSKLYGKYSVYELCESLDIARGTFYNHMHRNKKDSNSYIARREMLSIQIKKVFEESNQIYGSRKIKAVLNNQGYKTSERMVLELMQSMNLSSIRGKTKRQYKKYLKEGKKDRLKLNFTVNEPNQVWVSDTTYFKACNTSMHICAIIDLYSRKVISYKISKNNSTQLITSTFKQAYQIRQPSEKLVFHSDRGVQYAAFAFRKLLSAMNISQSFSPKGNPYHNSVMESFFSSLKSEELYRLNYRSISDFHKHVDKSIHKYNYERPHGTLLYKTPNAFEQAFYDNKN